MIFWTSEKIGGHVNLTWSHVRRTCRHFSLFLSLISEAFCTVFSCYTQHLRSHEKCWPTELKFALYDGTVIIVWWWTVADMWTWTDGYVTMCCVRNNGEPHVYMLLSVALFRGHKLWLYSGFCSHKKPILYILSGSCLLLKKWWKMCD